VTSQYPYIQFVATPDVGATLRYDFNDGITEVADLDLGVPTLLGDPDGINVQYGPREVTISQEIVCDRVTALDRLDLLAKEILRRRNWLLVQMDSGTAPVWYHTFRSIPESLQIEKLSDGTLDYYTISVTVLAEPAAYGALESVSETAYDLDQTVSGSAQVRMMLPTIKGNMPTPIKVEHYGRNGSTYLAVTDDWIACSPTTYSTIPYAKMVFTGVGGATRTWTPAFTNIKPGRYRVAVLSPTLTNFTGHRFGYSPDGGTTTIWASGCPAGAYSTTSRTLASGVSNRWFDLGEITFRTTDGAVIASPTVSYDAQSVLTSNTAGILLIPVVEFGVNEAATIMEHVKLPTSAASTLPTRFVIDDSDDHDHQALAGSTVGSQGYLFSATVAGASQLIAHPQWSNCLTLLGQVGTSGGSYFGYVKVYYRPRYLNLRGD
jgi:hypothetical protein